LGLSFPFAIEHEDGFTVNAKSGGGGFLLVQLMDIVSRLELSLHSSRHIPASQRGTASSFHACAVVSYID